MRRSRAVSSVIALSELVAPASLSSWTMRLSVRTNAAANMANMGASV